MFRKEIDAAFTAKVNEYVAQGYTFHTSTMGGSQGEIAKIDLCKDGDVIRIYLEHRNDWKNGDKIVLTVGRHTKQLCGAASEIIWMHNLETIEEIPYVEVAQNRYYVTQEEWPAIREKQFARWQARQHSDSIDLGEKAKAIVLPYVKRQPKCGRVGIGSIESVNKSIRRNGSVAYSVIVRGSAIALH